MEEKLDCIIFGITGFTGKLVLEYLFKNSQGVTFGVGGREENKIKSILKELKIENLSIKVFIADVSNENSLDEMCSSCKVLINCVGPYFKFGEPVKFKIKEGNKIMC
jgi:short subunit dehydrogenase-like uncharacterized protein